MYDEVQHLASFVGPHTLLSTWSTNPLWPTIVREPGEERSEKIKDLKIMYFGSKITL